MQTTGIQAYAINLSYSERTFNAATISRTGDGPAALTATSARINEFRLEAQFYSRAEFTDLGEELLARLRELGIELAPGRQTESADTAAAGGLDDLAYWGVAQTSERLANFVINGGNDNLDRLRAGREGIIRGFKEAEQIWGGQLPEISYQTLEKALETIDQRIHDLNGSVIDTSA